MRPLCNFVTTPNEDGSYTHVCAVCGFAKTLPSRRYVRPCGSSKASPTKPREPRGKCAHLGEATGETVGCATCRSAVLKIFGCGLHGECTIEKCGGNNIAVCRTCNDWTEQ